MAGPGQFSRRFGGEQRCSAQDVKDAKNSLPTVSLFALFHLTLINFTGW
jgi:hypothetical protein